MEYIPNGGQTYMPFQENTKVPTLPFTPLSRPQPEYPALALTEAAKEKGYVITMQAQHFLPGVTVGASAPHSVGAAGGSSRNAPQPVSASSRASSRHPIRFPSLIRSAPVRSPPGNRAPPAPPPR